MRILLDTNILIPLEDSSQVLGESFGELVRLSSEHMHQLLIHPASIEDIHRDDNVKRREISLSRIRKYIPLESPPIPTDEDIYQLGLVQANDNDRVDNILLFAIYKDAVNILVTEDRGLHRKANNLGLSDRVHYIQQARSFLERLHRTVPVTLPNIEEMSLHELDLSSNFFDSLRAAYPHFDTWYRRSARNGRKAWVYRDDESVPAAIAIYKIEENQIITRDHRGLTGRILKLCTFKVGERIRGRKIGELFLKAAFRYATSNGLTSIYITMRPGQQDFLKDLCVDFGFNYYGEYEQGGYVDDIYVKDHPVSPLESDLSGIEYHRHFYPHIKCSASQGKFIVPIQPRYHRMLFPEAQHQPLLFMQSGAHTVGNPIKQAYLCHARVGNIRPGDVLLFYRSRDILAITSIGLVESSYVSSDSDKIMEIVAKRTVYSHNEIVEMAQRSTKVLLFRLAMHFEHNIPYSWLLRERIVNGSIQTIRSITDTSFRRLIDEWGISNCFYPD
jgi:hypothetical protein